MHKNLLIFLGLMAFQALAATDLKTIAEKSGWTRTGRSNEVESLCNSFAKAYPRHVKCSNYGVTPEGRILQYVKVGSNKNAPVLWVQAGIHGGEIDGKDAFFWLLRESLQKEIKPNPFEGLTVIFIPIVNLDGHERFGKWNRPNQVGPEEMGWRVTAQNLNLNRDFAKASAPEMEALLKLWHRMDPILSLDLHVTDGAQFQPEVGIIINPNNSHGTTPLHKAGSLLETSLLERLTKRGRKALPFYPSFETDDEPLSGFSRYVSSPRFSQGYWYNNNRIGMLVETHSWKDYATRVVTHHDVILSALEIAKDQAKVWIAAAKLADETSLANSQVPLEYKHTGKSHLIEFPGYKYKREKSVVTGKSVIRYFPNHPEIWKVPFYEELIPSLSVTAPSHGYFVPAAEAKWLRKKLNDHGIRYSTWKGPAPKGLQVFRATETTFAPTPFEGRQTLAVKGQWKEEDHSLPTGSLFIPIQQPLARLIMQLFEPLAKDSFLAWGFFNRFFEKKEYMEDYVTEEVAREMLAKSPEIKVEFEARLESDASFAKDPAQRFEFFYRLHPSWDEAFNRYPVFRL